MTTVGRPPIIGACARLRAATALLPGLTVFVLLHGIGMSHRYYRRLQVLLARHGDTYAVDLPGFGGTPRPDRQLSVADYALHTAAALQKMGVSRAVVIGHSMGTQFATELAVQRPDMVSHLVLLGPVVDPARRTVFQQSLSLGLDSLLESPLGNATVFTDYARSGMRWYLTELPVMMTYDLQARLALANQPTLVIRASRDPVDPGPGAKNWQPPPPTEASWRYALPPLAKYCNQRS